MFQNTLYRISNLLTRPRTLSGTTSTRTLAAIASAAGGSDRVVVLGSGWAGFQIALNADKKLPLTVVSPNNHFVFTPLLASTAVGTLEFRCIQEPIRTVLGPKGQFIQAKARTLDPENKKIVCQSVHNDTFELEYDKLVIAVGVQTNTFGIPSIKEGEDIFFLKQLNHARGIRNNIIDSFEKSAVPTVSEAERRRLLSFVVVGGGPTSCEFVSELHDFIKHDVSRLYKDLLPFVKITLVEAGPVLLGPFDAALQKYAHGLFKKRDIDVRLGIAVTGVEEFQVEGFHFPNRRAMLSDGTSLEFGTMVWSAGLAPRNFTKSLDGILPKHSRNGRILVDPYLRVKGYEGSIWACGDAAVNEQGIVLPQLAQVARQQGIYLAKVLNGKQREDEKEFHFFSLGSMAYVGDLKGIYDGTTVGEPGKEIKHPRITGLLALLMWRFAYWGRQTSMVNKILIPMHWFKSFLFGRDNFSIALQVIITMKAVQVLLLAVVVACASAFSPVKSARPALKPLAMSNIPEPVHEMKEKNAAALAAFATAMAPFAAHAEAVDEATIIGYGAGLVACVVSLAVGFAIGYGTLVKL